MCGAPNCRRGLRRGILRVCRSLGRRWEPWPPACDALWGQGGLTDPTRLHPLLKMFSPRSVHEGLQAAGGQRPLGAWLREQFRNRRQDELANDTPDTQEVLDFLRAQGTLVSCRASSSCRGLRIDAVSGYLQNASQPAQGQFVFAYNFRFVNDGDRSLRILARQYDFRDASGGLSTQIKQDQLEAAGVVGFTPVLQPGEGFEFGSGVVLKTPRGMLTGKFLVMEEPAFEEGSEEHKIHESMANAELMLRLVYFKGLNTDQFYAPLSQLRFDANVACVSMARR